MLHRGAGLVGLDLLVCALRTKRRRGQPASLGQRLRPSDDLTPAAHVKGGTEAGKAHRSKGCAQGPLIFRVWVRGPRREGPRGSRTSAAIPRPLPRGRVLH